VNVSASVASLRSKKRCLERLGLAEVEHNARTNRMRAL
jgi:hypothetical protein